MTGHLDIIDQNVRVLLVEDEPQAAQVLATGRREQAYAVDLAADGETALAAASRSFPIGSLQGARGVTLRISGPSDISIRGDEELLRRLIMNLLHNAIQHSPSGGRVAVDISPNGSRLSVRVASCFR